MLSPGKRLMYVHTESDLSDEESDNGSFCSANEKISNNNTNKGRKQYNSSELDAKFQFDSQQNRRKRCYSKNALNARENRLKKKLYVENLEKTVEKYRHKNRQMALILNNQSQIIGSMKKQVQYFRNVLANSGDISKLLKCINRGTGMSVTTSLNKSLALTADVVHPWTELKEESYDFNAIHGEFNELTSDMSWDTLFSDFNTTCGDLSNLTEEAVEVHNESMTHEHNYTAKSPEATEKSEGAGICLHISNHKVSLEFCPTCSENASTAWKED